MDGEHPEWLPVDWKVCVKVRSSGKKDKYYVNLSNDLKFNSKPEVLRYLKNAVEDPEGRKLNKVDIKQTVSERLPSGWIEETRLTRSGKIRRDLSTAGAERQKLIDEKVNKTSFGDESKSVESESAAVENTDPPETDASGGKNSTAEEEQQEKAAVLKKRKKNSKWMNALPRRASKRLARVEADPPLQVKTSSGARETARTPDEAEVDTTNETTGESKQSGKTEVTSEDLDKQTTNLAVENRSSAECAKVDLTQDEKNGGELESSLNELFTDPCIEFAIKTLTGAIPLEEASKIQDGPVASTSSSVLPFGDIWADPCFEFAVKTLTSEIPTEDDSRFRISFSSGATRCNRAAK